MGEHEATDAGVGAHGSALGEVDAYLTEVQELVEQEVHAGVGQRGVAHGGAYALELLAVQLGYGELLAGGVAPDLPSHLLVQPLGGGLGQPVGQQLGHELAVGVVVEVGGHGAVGAGGEEGQAVAYG